MKNLGPQAPVVENELGGKQSKLDYAFHLTDPLANFALAEVFAIGAAKYAADNWRLIPVEEHLNHLLTHINAHMAGDTQDDHLGHALCRAHMALAKHLRPEFLGKAAKK